MEVGKLAEKNHLHRSKIKQHVRRLIVNPTRKGLFQKQSHNHTNTFSLGVPRRKPGGEKNKCHQALNQSLNLAFNPDPLNLSALCDQVEEGTNSPEVTSPIVDRSLDFEPVNVQLLDSHDPLNLNRVDDDLLKPAQRRKKRKRRRTATGNETEELMNILNNVSNFSNDSFDKSDISISEKNVSTKIEVNEPISDGEKIEHCGDKEYEKPADKSQSNKTYSSKKERQLFSFSEKNKRYRYGNYIDCSDTLRKNVGDQRLNFFRKEWFEGKDCLDIGCNTGKVTILVAKHFNPSKILGIDIDANVIKIAKRKAQECGMRSKPSSKFPLSFRLTYGPILGAKLVNRNHNAYGHEFPDNLSFRMENCVPTSESLRLVQPEYECILCLNLTKWVQLNFGDSALKLLFKKIFLLLKPGGRLLLEPQSYNSYKKKKKLMPETWKHFMEIKLMPTDFVSYLLSSEVGFARSQCLTYSRKGKTGYDRPMYLLEKSNSK